MISNQLQYNHHSSVSQSDQGLKTLTLAQAISHLTGGKMSDSIISIQKKKKKDKPTEEAAKVEWQPPIFFLLVSHEKPEFPFPSEFFLSFPQSKKHANKVRLFYMLHPEDGGPPSKRLRPDNPVCSHVCRSGSHKHHHLFLSHTHRFI